MFDCDFDFQLVIRDDKGELIHRGAANDFLPCYEDLLFSGVLAGSIPNDGVQPRARVEPVRNEERVTGLTMAINGTQKTYGLEVFANRVWEVLLAKGLLKDCLDEDRKTLWHVEAEKKQPKNGARRLAIAVHRQPYPIVDRPLADFGIQRKEEETCALEVYVARGVLDQLFHDTAESLDCERAAFLTGRLVRQEPGRAAVIIQDQIPATVDTTASKAHVSFSPLTFQAARQAIQARSDGGEIVAWAHNHPPTCGRDCLMKVPACDTETVFFSPNDRVVHRASFPAPYMVALVTGKGAGRRADDPIVHAYGWDNALVKEREFHIF